MDVFYEESATNQNAKKDARKYKIIHYVSYFFLIVGIIMLVITLFNFPFAGSGETVSSFRMFYGFIGLQGLFFMLIWFILMKLKRRFNASYDYCFVSGELRISKVFNINRRKLMVRIDCEDMIQVGDIDNPSYERFKSDPMTKEIICTPNVEATEGKFFMYVLANINGKKLYVLECRENLLMNIMKFAKRSVLESDYVMQERKQK
jgi:hypothetical protein